MSDALCGPSNAFQQFQKHTSVDRTLQQDRLISRQSPAQGFRSHDPTAGLLDPEFEAFQAGRPPGLAGPQFPTHEPLNHFQPPASHYNAAPSYAGPSQAPAWATDFQQQQFSPSPASLQRAPQAQNQHWDRLFNQPGGSSTVQYQSFQQPAMQYRASPAFGMTQQFGGQFQHSQFPSQAQDMQMKQDLQMDQFDEAAFERAFDAAMDDVIQDQDHAVDTKAKAVEQPPSNMDWYPHLPVLRVALLKAVLDGSDRSLHDAALLLHQLNQHDPSQIDPVQAMLLQPVIYRLVDSTHSSFPQRYGQTLNIESLKDTITNLASTAHIDQTNERLLAAYADTLWGRDQTNHLANIHQDPAEDNIWRERFRYDVDAIQQRHVSDTTLHQLDRSGINHLDDLQSILRVLNLEVDAFKDRHPDAAQNAFDTSNPASVRAALSNMAKAARQEPELVEAIGEPSILTGNFTAQAARQEYEAQLRLLERQNAEMQAMREQRDMETEAENLDPATELDMEEAGRLLREDLPQEEITEQQQQQQSRREDDELAETAAELLTKISDNQTDKFKNSAFLGLMRKLADREVRVEGDKMVETGSSSVGRNIDGQPIAPSTYQSAQGHVQTTPVINTQTAPRDGQEVIDILNQPGNEELGDATEFLMTSPFASADDY